MVDIITNSHPNKHNKIILVFVSLFCPFVNYQGLQLKLSTRKYKATVTDAILSRNFFEGF